MSGQQAFVYVIEADNGDVKVGVSGTPYARLSKIKRTYGPSRGFRDARLVGFVDCRDPFSVELLAIRSLVHRATGGEWFAVDPLQAVAAVVAAALSFEEAPYFRWTAMERAASRRRGSRKSKANG